MKNSIKKFDECPPLPFKQLLLISPLKWFDKNLFSHVKKGARFYFTEGNPYAANDIDSVVYIVKGFFYDDFGYVNVAYQSPFGSVQQCRVNWFSEWYELAQ